MTTALITGPTIEPVTLADVKAHLRDRHRRRRPTPAGGYRRGAHPIEVATRRALIRQTWRLYLDGWPEGRAVPDPRFAGDPIAAVTFYDIAGVARQWGPENWRPTMPRRRPGWSPRAERTPALYDNGVEIDIVAGYGVSSIDVPAPLRQAVMVLVASWYERRGMVGARFRRRAGPARLRRALIAPFKVRTL